MMDAGIFLFLYCLNLSFHNMLERAKTVKYDPTTKHGISGAFAAVVGNHGPAVDSVREFLIHIVVYAGYVFPKH